MTEMAERKNNKKKKKPPGCMGGGGCLAIAGGLWAGFWAFVMFGVGIDGEVDSLWV